MILTRLKDPPGPVLIQSIGTGTVLVFKGSAANSILEIGTIARADMER